MGDDQLLDAWGKPKSFVNCVRVVWDPEEHSRGGGACGALPPGVKAGWWRVVSQTGGLLMPKVVS